jgi:hypothetical protein
MKHWIEAARVRTLPLSVSGILVGSFYAMSQGIFNWKIVILALSTTLGLQILSNFANDYGDGVKGTDNEERIGPKRAIQSGLITPGEMRYAIFITAFLTLVSAMLLIYVSFKGKYFLYSIIFFVLGILAIASAIRYTVGKNPYGYRGLGDVFVGPKFQNQILKPFKVNENINSKFFENSATISPDGKTLYFSSDRPGGFGGFDLYRSLILPNGEWSEALNLGPDINTAYDEDFPFLSMDGNVLYFASKGHNSMGGFDVFKSDFSEEKNQWGTPLNLGYPVNNAYDNNGICMSGKGRYGYVSAIRPEGKGDLDIYRVTFNTIDAELTVVKGVIGSGDGGNKLLNPTLTVLNASTNKVVGEYIPNPITNKYVVILPPGEYFLKVKCGGYQDYKEKISIMGKGSFVPEMEKNVTMLPRK